MELKNRPLLEIPPGLLDAIQSLPVQREVEHCGHRMTVSPFDIYADCPQCGSRLKVRSFSAAVEIEDVFDAVFEWMIQPMAQEVAKRRQETLAEENEEE
jgi:hypothetical protein